MATFPVDIQVDFVDAAERTATLTYRLALAYDNIADNFLDVINAADDVMTAINVLTWDKADDYALMVRFGTAGSPANISSNNQVRAFTRVLDDAGEKSSIEIPAWDDFVFDEDSNNLLSAAYNTAALALALLLQNPDNGEDFASVSFTQSRTHKSRNIVS